MIYFFSEVRSEHQSVIGAKGWILARLYQAGYPVPNGFVILPDAFDGDELKPSMLLDIKNNLEILRQDNKHTAFAVRSSAQGEDTLRATFAGQFETILNLIDEKSLIDAICLVRKSLNNERVHIYSQLIKSKVSEIAVIVQVMIVPDFSGIMFSANPITGNNAQICGNFVCGIGSRLAHGDDANTESFTIRRSNGKYEGPKKLKKYEHGLFALMCKVEKEMGILVDIEWAIANERLFILQARPITALRQCNPNTGEWNDSYRGDYLWTRTNWGEAVPEVMTPFTWSLFLRMAEMSSITLPGNHPSNGNIAGRLYFNAGLYISMASALKFNIRKFINYGSETFGQLPDNVHIPIIPFTTWDILSTFGISLIREWITFPQRKQKIPNFLLQNNKRVKELRCRIQATQTADDLKAVWILDIEPLIVQTNQMMDLVVSKLFYEPTRLRNQLERVVGSYDASVLLGHSNSEGETLSSLQPMLELTKVINGSISKDEYSEKYGHRCQHEIEVSMPRPGEDPSWMEKLIAESSMILSSISKKLTAQQLKYNIAREHLISCHSAIAPKLLKSIERIAEQARVREAVRSEFARMFWVIRCYALRVGELTGIGDDVFFLSLKETQQVLQMDHQPLEHVTARRQTHTKYCSLPSYPVIISGHFDPIVWAQDPNRRYDIFDSHQSISLPYCIEIINGIGASSGTTEGLVRNITGLEQADEFQAGEILVTRMVNVGWIALFSRASAIITDIGAPLSHAAIAARELGIPMVVGCLNASTRLTTGDRVRVNGEKGTIDIIDSQAREDS